MSKAKSIKFKYKGLKIESAFAFKDGDFIIFGNGDSTECGVNKNYSTLYDGKTFKVKTTIEVSDTSCFFYLNEEEFGLCYKYNFKSYKFNKDRTSYTEIQPFPTRQFETGKKLMSLLNGDILFFKFYMGSIAVTVYRKNNDNSLSSFPFQNDDYLYKKQENYIIEDCEDIIELNDKEFMAYKRLISSETLKLSIFNNENYKILKEKKISMEDKMNSSKKRLYFTTEIYKIGYNKLICAGCTKIYIIDLKSLELETTILLNKIIEKILIRPKGNIFILTYENIRSEVNIFREVKRITRKSFLNNIKIDFKTNEIIQKEETDMTDQVGIYSSSFQFFNYPNNGLIIIIDNEQLFIYNNYGD